MFHPGRIRKDGKIMTGPWARGVGGGRDAPKTCSALWAGVFEKFPAFKGLEKFVFDLFQACLSGRRSPGDSS